MSDKEETCAILPKITRWFTSNGADTIWLEKSKKATVPANLAKWLVTAGYAEET